MIARSTATIVMLVSSCAFVKMVLFLFTPEVGWPIAPSWRSHLFRCKSKDLLNLSWDVILHQLESIHSTIRAEPSTSLRNPLFVNSFAFISFTATHPCNHQLPYLKKEKQSRNLAISSISSFHHVRALSHLSTICEGSSSGVDLPGLTMAIWNCGNSGASKRLTYHAALVIFYINL